jgi:hypothetical protein
LLLFVFDVEQAEVNKVIVRIKYVVALNIFILRGHFLKEKSAISIQHRLISGAKIPLIGLILGVIL